LPIRVLLVDHDASSAVFTSVQIRQSDDIFRVEWKMNLVNAISRLAKPGVDLILLDLGLPESSCHKTHLAITSTLQKQVPIVIFTSDESVISQEMTKLQGAPAYLIKHLTSLAELRRALREAVVSPVTWKELSTDTSL
jgi:DNA-binding response OmpR family regulator